MGLLGTEGPIVILLSLHEHVSHLTGSFFEKTAGTQTHFKKLKQKQGRAHRNHVGTVAARECQTFLGINMNSLWLKELIKRGSINYGPSFFGFGPNCILIAFHVGISGKKNSETLRFLEHCPRRVGLNGY